ncbi:undecaprenyl/decaprenyl-phosphate alpha-N-acetylglucosaminyl 1-phosphate transferase [Pelagibacterales bacterium SAG-MED14]|nr:undecaprenyl/decaprenyl-phosphate alpha-N-acetylglucosaminyl 1-phosphate transferase [Pelagibacterales bacterium SAG-MED14]
MKKKLKILDKPDNFRKIHKTPVPLFGGVFVFFIILVTIFFDIFFNEYQSMGNRETVALLVGALFFFILGLYDDVFFLKPTAKLYFSLFFTIIIIHIDSNLIVSSLSFSFLENEIALSNFSKIFSILCFLIFINALNMFDGLNGQCTLYSLFLALIFSIFSNLNIYLVSLVIILGFFLFINIQGKSFLGDSGSYLLGFILSFFIIRTYNIEMNLSTDLIFLLMYLPGFDLIRLFTIRLINNKNPFSADKNHIHHIYLKKFNETQTLFIIQLLSFIPFFMTFYIENFLIIILFAIMLYSLPIYYINKK